MQALMEPIKKTRLYEEISEEILRLIKSGSLQPGDKLPPERQLSEQLQVSRTAIREALRSLEAQGYLESKVGGGTFVRSVTVDSMLSPFSVMLAQHDQQLRDLMRVRELLEVEAASLAAKHITEADRNRLREVLDEMDRSIKAGANSRIDDDNFHDLIAEISRNTALYMICELCSKLLSETRQATMDIPGQPQKTLVDHRKIADAIIKGDPAEAARQMRLHLRKARKALEAQGKQKS